MPLTAEEGSSPIACGIGECGPFGHGRGQWGLPIEVTPGPEKELGGVVIAEDLVTEIPCVTPQESLPSVNEKLWFRDLGHLPVVDSPETRRFDFGSERMATTPSSVSPGSIRNPSS